MKIILLTVSNCIWQRPKVDATKNQYAKSGVHNSFSSNTFPPLFMGRAPLSYKITDPKTGIVHVIKTGSAKIKDKKPVAAIAQRIKDEWAICFSKSELLTPLRCVKPFVNEHNAAYVDALLERVGENGLEGVIGNLISVGKLARVYNKHPEARGLMRMAFEATGSEPKSYLFGLDEIARGVFGENYGGQDYQNLLIERLIEAKRYSAAGIGNILKSYVPSKKEAFDMLAAKQVQALQDVDKKALTEIVENVPKTQIKWVLRESFLPINTHLLEEDCDGIEELLKYCTPDKNPALKMLIDADMGIAEMTKVLKVYKPKDRKILDKMLYVKDDGGGDFFSASDIVEVLQERRRVEKLKKIKKNKTRKGK